MALCVSLRWISLLLCISVAYGGNLFGGDSSGNLEFILFEGTPYTFKLEFGSMCTRTNTGVEVEMRVIHADENLTYSDLNLLNPGERVRYETCTLIQGDAWESDGSIDDADSCTGGTDMELLTPADEEHEYASWTLWKTIDIPDDTSPLPCGGINTNGDYCFYFNCKRDKRLNMLWDVIVKLCVPDTADNCNLLMVDSQSLHVADEPTSHINRSKEVGMSVFANDMISGIPDIQDGPTGHDVVGALKIEDTDVVELGTAIFFEICLENNNEASFSLNNMSTLGLQPYDCVFTPSQSGSALVDPTARANATDDYNCGYEDIMAPWPTNEHVFKFVHDPAFQGFELIGDISDEPNCWRSPWTEAAVFALTGFYDQGFVEFHCQLLYCKDAYDTRCFPEDDHSMCAGDKRKKRDVSDDIADQLNLPREVSATFRIDLPATTEEQQAPCFEKNTFIALSSSLGVLLLVVLIVASYLAVRLWSDPDDEFSRTTDSMTGYQNKQYSY